MQTKCPKCGSKGKFDSEHRTFDHILIYFKCENGHDKEKWVADKLPRTYYER